MQAPLEVFHMFPVVLHISSIHLLLHNRILTGIILYCRPNCENMGSQSRRWNHVFRWSQAWRHCCTLLSCHQTRFYSQSIDNQGDFTIQPFVLHWFICISLMGSQFSYTIVVYFNNMTFNITSMLENRLNESWIIESDSISNFISLFVWFLFNLSCHKNTLSDN